MFTAHDYEVAKMIVVGIHLPPQLGVNSSDDTFDSDWVDYEVSKNYSGDFHIDNGVSKMVIIPENEDFVIKIPFNGMYEYEWDDDEEDYDWENPSFDYFTGAHAPDQTDYCWDEMLAIEKANKAGFGWLFPHTEFLMCQDGIRFYIQEKVRTSRAFHPVGLSQNSRDTAENMTYRYQSGNAEWRATIVEVYGEDFWINFVNWDDENRVGILTDMHSMNYGYDMSGCPVILDASGFRN